MCASRKNSTGPRGGTTTRQEGRVRFQLWFDGDEWEALRQRAHETEASKADIVRQAVREFLDLEP